MLTFQAFTISRFHKFTARIFEIFRFHSIIKMMQYDEKLMQKVPLDYDIKKIGFILLPEETDKVEEQNVNSQNNKAMPSSPSNLCHICNRFYQHRNSLRRHLATVHVTKIYECETCSARGIVLQFDSQRKLSDHKRLHKKLVVKKSQVETKLECSFCGQEERNKNELDLHMELHQEITLSINDILPVE